MTKTYSPTGFGSGYAGLGWHRRDQIELGKQVAKVAGAGDDVLNEIGTVSDTIAASRRRHQLHQTDGAGRGRRRGDTTVTVEEEDCLEAPLGPGGILALIHQTSCG